MLDRHVLLDSSCLINILATSRAAEVLRLFPAGAGVCTAVAAEALFLRGESPEQPKIRIVLEPFVQQGLLDVHPLCGEREQTLYVDLAADLDDGEAMTIAIAHCRNLAVATDDRKARRIAGERFGAGLPLAGTAGILHEWAQAAASEPSTVRDALRRVESIARFRPPAADPLLSWWMATLA